ncbi:histidine kinase [Ruania suaedae]|uniref:sensor histidine kinase n=1 Tax=Ruania suaedae TaxID=2897774 RepID=UPI001E498908|nr:histidine kinase [Ruania suaedae]UFU04043.1 histidine kinase [Ruania suaedae]
MERTTRVQIWAGVSMLVLCVLIGAVEGASVLTVGGWAYLAPWLVVFLGYLAALVLATARSAPATLQGRLLLMATPVLLSNVIVLLSPSRGGLGYILLVLTVGIAALHVEIRWLAVVVLWNSAVVAAAGAGLGPLVENANAPAEILIMTFLYGLLQVATATMVWSQQRVEHALRQLSVAHVELRSTSALLAESSQAQERLRISRELHDVLGHQLTVLSVELEVASHRADGPAREHVLRARGLAKDLLADVRSVVGSQRERSFDLPGALARVTEEIPHPRVHLEIEAGLQAQERHAATVVRAVQEIATNTIRHSHAENLWISLTTDDDALLLGAHDDGVGAVHVVPGNGLRGLRERAEAVGGRVDIDGSSGFRIQVELPARQEVPA